MAMTPEQAIEIFRNATEENGMDPNRQGQVVHLPEEGELWIAGDIHDHRRNFDKMLKAADLPNHPERQVVLQELIHGDRYDADGAEESWVTLLRAAELKCDYPAQVHFLLANHDLAQIQGEGIMKGGASVCEAFTRGIKKAFAPRHHSVNAALSDFLLSFPLAVRCPNGVFCCHSLPTDAQLPTYDYTVFTRELTGPDYARRTGPVYQLIWGRNTSPEGATAFAEAVGATLLVTGHQPQEMGWATVGDRQLIIASDHNQGVFLRANLTEPYSLNELTQRLTKFVAVDVE